MNMTEEQKKAIENLLKKKAAKKASKMRPNQTVNIPSNVLNPGYVINDSDPNKTKKGF